MAISWYRHLCRAMSDKTLLIAFATLLINIPFGYWRECVRKFSRQWFVAVHAAVPLVMIMRTMAGLEWRPLTVALFVACYFSGQFVGARMRKKRGGSGPWHREAPYDQ